MNENHNQHIIDNLTNNEKSILYWASNGKTSEETSFILGLTKHTVQTYRKKAIQKLNLEKIGGVTRLGICVYNTEEEIRKTIDLISKI